MKDLIILFLLLGWSGACAQDYIEWNEDYRLTVSDFKGPAPDPTLRQTLAANIGIEVKLLRSEIQELKSFNNRVTNVFRPQNSWIDSSEKSRLHYAITLFDLNEWMARELRKRLNENRPTVLAGQYPIIQEQVRQEFEKIRQDYDRESSFGENPQGQANWEALIKGGIHALKKYCKTCGKRN